MQGHYKPNLRIVQCSHFWRQGSGVFSQETGGLSTGVRWASIRRSEFGPVQDGAVSKRNKKVVRET